jgi:elongation factor P
MAARVMELSDIRKNLKILLDGQPYVVTEFQFVKPGKGQGFTRCKLRNMETGAVLEKTFRASDKLEAAEVEQRTLQYIYQDGENFVFMDPVSGEQLFVPGDKIVDEQKWLADGMNVEITLLKDAPIGIDLPAHVELEVTQSDPGMKGDTASGATKPATLSTGAVVNVPLFIEEGDWLRIDTRTGSYIERVKK